MKKHFKQEASIWKSFARATKNTFQNISNQPSNKSV